jgi:hypothetical protein
VYYISNDPDELRAAIGYCEKGIVERAGEKTWSNARLTRANIYGKLCLQTSYASDDDVLMALRAYREALDLSALNKSYIDELLRKSQSGRHYLSKLCTAASSRPKLLAERDLVRELTSYVQST